MVTAVFGGVLRDIVCNDIPKVFRDHRPADVVRLADLDHTLLVGARSQTCVAGCPGIVGLPFMQARAKISLHEISLHRPRSPPSR